MSSFGVINNNISPSNSTLVSYNHSIAQNNNAIVPNGNVISYNHGRVSGTLSSVRDETIHGNMKGKYFENSVQPQVYNKNPTKTFTLPTIHQNTSLDNLLLAATKIEFGDEFVNLQKGMFQTLRNLTSSINFRVKVVEDNVLCNNTYLENQNLGVINELIIHVQDLIKKRMDLINNSDSSNKIYLPLPLCVSLPSFTTNPTVNSVKFSSLPKQNSNKITKPEFNKNKTSPYNNNQKSPGKRYTLNVIQNFETNNDIPKILNSSRSSVEQKSLPSIDFITSSSPSTQPVTPVSMSSGPSAGISSKNQPQCTKRKEKSTFEPKSKKSTQKTNNSVFFPSKNSNKNNTNNNTNAILDSNKSNAQITHVINNFTSKKCFHCGSKETPEWRTGPYGKHNICNACGLFYRKVVKKFGASNANLLMNYRRQTCCDNRRVPAFISLPNNFLPTS